MSIETPHHEHPRLAARRQHVDRFVRPVQSFISTETSGGVVLLVAAFIALAWANSPWSDTYHQVLEHHLSVDLGFWALDKSVHFWVNDVLMVIFFFVVGLEIKREAVVGELADPRRVIVPIVAAIGGMVGPALIFVLLVGGNPGSGGWGIPIATDIAFAMGVLAVVGTRVPFGLKVMLLALAIVDDIGGIIVIAVFYTSDLAILPLAATVGLLGLAYVLRQVGIWYIPVYIAIGVAGWITTYESGIHPTIIGVLLGLLAPWKAWYQEAGFSTLAEREVLRFREAAASHDHDFAHEQKLSAAMTLHALSQKAISPLDRFEHQLAPIAAFVIVPLFAFANAGVALSVSTLEDAMTAPVALGVFFGLLVGKPGGILLATWLVVRAGAKLPTGVTWPAVAGIGCLGGIGFTVSLLITELSFTDRGLVTDAKIGIIFASAFAGILGFGILKSVYGGPSPRE
ncbi:MAG: Na+/H+ antiporter NhaA [Chloroflexi bacterium]|nr:Na+/H+ antiporter NhaA [Chloroflexota bacterium]MDA1239577.1 Na+/H+ antiporter NhaA [Chloroflexota bacterium]